MAVWVVQYLGTLDRGYGWFFHAVVILTGVLLASPYGLLTVWLCRPSKRPPQAGANPERTTGVTESDCVPAGAGS